MVKLKELRIVLHRIDSIEITKKKRAPEPVIKNLTHLEKKLRPLSDPVLTRPGNPPSVEVAFHLCLTTIKKEVNDSISSEDMDNNINPLCQFESAINQPSGRSEILKTIKPPNYSDFITIDKKTENVAGNSYSHSDDVAVDPTEINILNNNRLRMIVQNTSKIREIALSSGIKDTLNLSTYFCRICYANFNYISTESINEHENIHAEHEQRDEYRRATHTTDEFPYNCHVCGKKFNLKQQLNDHMKNHTENESYFCKYCSQVFENQDTLRQHVEISHTVHKIFECQSCDKTFSGRYRLVEHTRTHTGEFPYVCHVCGTKFHQKRVLNDHMIKTHPAKSDTTEHTESNDTCFKHPTPSTQQDNQDQSQKSTELDLTKSLCSCKYCAKIFENNDNLRQHVEISHKVDKRFECHSCDKKFKHRYRLVEHIQTHTMYL